MSRHQGRRGLRRLLTVLLLLPLAGCGIGQRLAEVGQAPALQPISDPTQRSGYKPVSLPMPEPEPVVAAGPNSLWRSGGRGFFRDQRARRVGDLLTVHVTIADQAKWSNETERSRDTSDTMGITDFFGLQSRLTRLLPGSPDPSSLVDTDSTTSNVGKGKIDRKENVILNVAALITQVLPNGNMVIEGRQEVRINHELREVMVAGVVRPEDITPLNSIDHEKIAELRVGYGGRGQLSDVQQPRYGAQVMDILLPY